MKTTFTKSFEKGFMHGLAGVSRRKSRKQVLQDIVSEAEKGLDMARGLQGRGDWYGAASKVVSSAGLLDQAVDLAETLPGVNFERTRQQAKLVVSRIGKAMNQLDIDPLQAREQVRNCEIAVAKAVEAIRIFSNRLRDDVLSKDGSKVDFDEDEIIKEVDKVMLSGASAKDPGARQRQRIGEQAGIFHTGKTGTGWEAVPGKPGRQRRKKEDGTYEYRDVAAAVSASRDEEDVKKDEELEDDSENPEQDETKDVEKPAVSEKEEKSPSESVVEEVLPEVKSLDPSDLLRLATQIGDLAKAKKGKKVKPGSLKGGKSEPSAKAPIGSGKRFEALVEDLKNKGIDIDALQKAAVRDSAALAAALGRAKYGKKRFQEMAAEGRKKAAKNRKKS
jgi:hypothetical protein